MSNKFVAWGANIMIRVRNPNFSEGGIILAGEKNKPIEPQGVVVSCGLLVRDGLELIDRTVRFNSGMIMDDHGLEGKEIFVLVNEAAIHSVSVGESEGVSLR